MAGKKQDATKAPEAPKAPDTVKAPEAPKAPDAVKAPELAEEGTVVKAINKQGQTLEMTAEHYNEYSQELTLVDA